MKKEMIVIIVALVIIAALAASIVLLVTPLGSSIFPQTPRDTNPANIGASDAIEQLQPTDPDCPTELMVYHSINRVDTITLADDIVSLNVRNPDNRDYDVRVMVNDKTEGIIKAKALSSTGMESPTLTNWWRAQSSQKTGINQTPSRGSFAIALSVEGCDRTTSEIVPTAPIFVPSGGGGGGTGGGSGEEDGGASGGGSDPTSDDNQIVIDITPSENALPD